MNNHKDELQFVVDRYREGHKNAHEAWRAFERLSGKDRANTMKRRLVAASIAFAAIIAAAATVYVIKTKFGGEEKSMPTTEQIRHQDNAANATDSVVKKQPTTVFLFNQTPINEALNKISTHYGVRLVTNDSTKKVTGEFEAHNVDEAKAMLEAALGIEITKQ